MPFIDTPIEHHFPWYVRLFFWNQKRRYGTVLEPARLWGRSPRVFAALTEFESSTRFSEREIAFQNLSSKFNASLGLEAQGFCSTAPQTKIDVRR